MKTSELTGPALDWAVAKAQGWTDYPNDSIERGSKWHCDPERTPFGRVMWKNSFQPSTDWSQGGPIIEREDIQWCRLNGQIESWSGFDYIEWRTNWDSEARMPEGSGFGTGHTLLITAMRCFVTSKLGDEVDVPKELTC